MAAARDSVDDHLDRWSALWTDVDGYDREVEGALSRMMSITKLSSQRLRTLLRHDPLSYDEFMTLHALVGGEVKEQARSTPAELAKRTGVTRAGMTSRVDKLVRAGLATRTEDPKDRRSIVIEITPDGRAAWDRIITLWTHEEQRLLSALSVTELRRLNVLLRRVLITAEADATSER
ncbi:MarR family transcriptional regulator [Calidifontibacter sp. DB0510]|uniref:MarR family transcriptional regulator n=1 Tax=Metallococcus carri TaxID=1656884 RepID=A0A967B2G5_9MICO|nr:MarR family transcriptional regulator [Metallococcus carri]NHN54417.1 MarR family transcriptional regulator [Metallococcus carri]NOP36744.1 MarR family transcriptional regulator [Calidifontibacter sp. DB2511S]